MSAKLSSRFCAEGPREGLLHLQPLGAVSGLSGDPADWRGEDSPLSMSARKPEATQQHLADGDTAGEQELGRDRTGQRAHSRGIFQSDMERPAAGTRCCPVS